MWTQTGTSVQDLGTRGTGVASPRRAVPVVARPAARARAGAEPGDARAGGAGAQRRVALAGAPVRAGEVLGAFAVIGTALLLWTAFFAAVARPPAPVPERIPVAAQAAPGGAASAAGP